MLRYRNKLIPIVLFLLLLTGCQQQVVPPTIHQPVPSVSQADYPSTPPADGAILQVTYLDVGQGDATLLTCDGKSMLIDGGEVDQSNTMYAALKSRGIDHLDYIVASHAHSDHIGGLPGALNYATADTALCPVTEYDSKAFSNFEKYLGKQGVSITVPTAGETFQLGSATITVLGPTKEYEDANNTSIVLRATFGTTSFVFTGDMEREAEADLLASGVDVTATVLKVGHHGSTTSTSYPFLRAVAPQYAVIEVGKDNSYGHPHDEILSRLRDADTTVYRTDLQGDITCTSDGTTVVFSTAKSASTDAVNPTITDGTGQNATPELTGYIGNINSMKFHRTTCTSLPSEQNQIQFESRAEAIDAGYSPCGQCTP